MEHEKMTRYVIGPDVALYLARQQIPVADQHRLLSPTLLRSQVLSLLYRAARQGEITREEADRRLARIRSLRIRLLGDRVLQEVAWKIAVQLDRPDTLLDEYVALTRLQADALITLDEEVAAAVKGVVATAPVDALSRPASIGGSSTAK
jgi:predicted nucleic acid-binding protein